MHKPLIICCLALLLAVAIIAPSRRALMQSCCPLAAVAAESGEAHAPGLVARALDALLGVRV